MHGEDEALLQAFSALLPAAAPDRRAAVLRNAIVQLLGAAEPGSSSRSLVERSPSISVADTDAWQALKPRIRSELQLRHISMGVMAEETGLPRSSLEKALSPKGSPPGRLVAEKLAGWLDTSVNQPRSAPTTAVPAKNGHDRAGPLPPNRLDAAQADLLLVHLTHMSDRDCRAQLGLTLETAKEAAARKDLAPEIIARVAVFLTDGVSPLPSP